MQRLYRDADGKPWYDGLDAVVRRKVENRFLRVLYERHARSSPITAEGEARFRSDLLAAWREAPEVAVDRLLERQRLRHWSFDLKADRIQIVFHDSVYDGHVDHRH